MAQTCKIESLADVIEAANDLEHDWNVRVWWRGQSAQAKPGTSPPERWTLKPRLFRMEHWGQPAYESNLLYEFQLQGGTRHHKCPDDRNLGEWLFLAQHYRLPTRLLDWTESPLLATYFAVTDTKYEKKPGSLYALNPYILNYYELGEAGILLPTHEAVDVLISEAFGHPIHSDRILAVGAKQVDIRMLVQQSGFTIHGREAPIEELERHDDFLVKYEVPVSAKTRLNRELKLAALRPASVFPDLETLARELEVKPRGDAAARLRSPPGTETEDDGEPKDD
jgi:hypothetical protein